MRSRLTRGLIGWLAAGLLAAGLLAAGLLAAGLLAACTIPSPAALAPAGTASPAPVLLPTASPSASPALPSPSSSMQASSPGPAGSLGPTPTRLPSATPTPVFAICSPLEGVTLDELAQPDLLKNPFDPPAPGQDSGHHGADFAYWTRGERDTMLGLPVRAALPGRVAAVLADRPPYGNALIIETALEALPPVVIEALPVPTPGPTLVPDASLFCPEGADFGETGPGRSIYLLYAHLQEAPLVEPGDSVSCGEQIGKVGTTGKSVNPHLHLEARAGPSGAVFGQMAHYDNAATLAEMATYCAWRVSGGFGMFNPLDLLQINQ